MSFPWLLRSLGVYEIVIRIAMISALEKTISFSDAVFDVKIDRQPKMTKIDCKS
jgi:hypothetical protein